ncbi:DUF6331 family protein [Agrobacterium sp. rho-8.1]|nr:DUF6331 family protein [Agrobacterium sp. rho-8.1]
MEITFPPNVSALCKTCETICEQECCGILAFNFSAFNIIYHLTKINARIFDRDVAEIRSELDDIAKKISTLDRHADKVTIIELNAILTAEQVISLLDFIDSAISDACAIYAVYKNQIELNDQDFSNIVKAPK